MFMAKENIDFNEARNILYPKLDSTIQRSRKEFPELISSHPTNSYDEKKSQTIRAKRTGEDTLREIKSTALDRDNPNNKSYADMAKSKDLSSNTRLSESESYIIKLIGDLNEKFNFLQGNFENLSTLVTLHLSNFDNVTISTVELSELKE